MESNADEFDEDIHSSNLNSLSFSQELLISEGVSQEGLGREVASPRYRSQLRTSNNRSSNNDGELTPLLQSDASSETSEDNPLVNYSSIDQNVIRNNIDSPEVSCETDSLAPRHRRRVDQYTRGISRSRRNTGRSIESESDCSIIAEDRAISFGGALKIPGVLEFSLCLFFAKLVSYTFLYWLPTFIMDTALHVSLPSFNRLI